MSQSSSPTDLRYQNQLKFDPGSLDPNTRSDGDRKISEIKSKIKHRPRIEAHFSISTIQSFFPDFSARP
jgi:hypothetical protein